MWRQDSKGECLLGQNVGDSFGLKLLAGALRLIPSPGFTLSFRTTGFVQVAQRLGPGEITWLYDARPADLLGDITP
jgi:hypothetical protein